MDMTQKVPNLTIALMGLTILMLIIIPIYLFRKLSDELRLEFKCVMLGILTYVLCSMALPMLFTLPLSYVNGMTEFVDSNPNAWSCISGLIYSVCAYFSMWVVIRFFMARNRSGADMFAFSVAFTGTEAVALAALTILGNLMLAFGINSTGLEVLMQDVPADQVESTLAGLQATLLNSNSLIYLRSFLELLLAFVARLAEGMLFYLAFTKRISLKWTALGFVIEFLLRVFSMINVERTLLYYVIYDGTLLVLAAGASYLAFRLYARTMPEDVERVREKLPKWALRLADRGRNN